MKTKISLFLIFIAGISTSAFADGFIVMPRPIPGVRSPYPLEVNFHKVSVELENLSAVTNVDQEFYNPTNSRLEGYYIFPIPANAAIKKFSMFIDGKETEAELLDAVKARGIYEDIVRKQLDPALLEYSDRSAFKVRIFPIEPRSSKRIRLSYSETLKRESGAVEYLYPLNTEKFSAKDLGEVSIDVTLKSMGEIKNIASPTHVIRISNRKRSSAEIAYSERNVKPDTDFRLLYTSSESDIGFFLRAYRDSADDGYFFMDVSPKNDIAPSDIVSKDIVFVLDTSGSMAGEKIDQAKRALQFCIDNLNPQDRFQIIRFSTETDSLFENVMTADNENRRRAGSFVHTFKAIGGTNIEEGLKRAIDSFRKDSRPKVIVFITDGKPTIGETDDIKLADMIKKWNGINARIFTFGIGSDIHTILLDRITEQTRAYRTYFSHRDNLEEKISQFYKKIQSPVMTDITLKVSNVKISKLLPRNFPDLYAGSSIVIMGRYSGEGAASVTLEGLINGKLKKYTYSAEFPKVERTNEYIPSLWAARRVGYLLDLIRLSGENSELKDEIVQLARQFGIITPYTSYLVLEDEVRRVDRHSLKEDHAVMRKGIPAPAEEKEMRKNYFSMKNSSGDDSVNASGSIQSLSQADNIARQRTKIKSETDKSGSVSKMQSRSINGQTFYQNGKSWVDSRIAVLKNPKVQKVKFASDEYFDLITKDKDMSQFLSIGRNVTFKYKDTVFEIIE